jgi:uncharacterized protein (TIGR01244 family)
MLRKLDDKVSVAGQLTPADLAEARAQGFTAIVNNRPDGEQPGQPTDVEIAAAADANGLAYTAIPVGPAGLGEAQVSAMAGVLEQADGPVLAFCRSGTRSTYLWALARARLGDDADTLVEKAEAAGYDISGIRGALG